MKVNHSRTSKIKRTLRVRSKVRGTTERPRLHVFRSNKGVYLQVINDQEGKTLVASNSAALKKAKGTKTEITRQVAEELAEKLKKAKITKLVFDRGSYKYHGRVQAVADVMREKGLEV
jgi:large subunit ribosomal protein L18